MYGTFLKGVSQEGDKYGFVNEHEIRLSAGVTLVFGLISIFFVLFKGEFLIPLVLLGAVWIDFILRVFIDPRASVFSAIVRPFIKREPYWIGSVQKRFAWSIGLFISSAAVACLVFQSGLFVEYGETFRSAYETIQKNLKMSEFVKDPRQLMLTPITPPMILCLICLVFMWLESVAGYCVGCAIYGALVKRGWWKAHPRQNCADGSCEI